MKTKQLLLRFNNLEDKDNALLEKWFSEIKKNKGSINKKVNDVLIEYLKAKELETSFSKVYNDMFYAFRKATFASLAPFQNELVSHLKTIKTEIDLLNMKQNAYFKHFDINLDKFNKDYFEDYHVIREARVKSIDEIKKFAKEQKDKFKELERSFERFKNAKI
ncbi:Mbov_0398 family ICE element protein [Mycoplasma anserisalpingitidis]|uniref:Mbov_0398 family ICE element protein n=1 Tax=Mycoplasma anserisalpingitidis TaxID=519450 RepID=UPI0011B158D5|nr:hypothetical protein [Mycoplasma anserisalpingitidis]QDY87719.1 hypothetical protein FOY45_02155 [Mycoplasma anserisalpingitidis]